MRRDVADYRDAKAADDGERVALDELLSEDPEGTYDDLSERDQALVRANWDEQIVERRASLDLAAEFTQAERSWTEADEQGRPVARNAETDA